MTYFEESYLNKIEIGEFYDYVYRIGGLFFIAILTNLITENGSFSAFMISVIFSKFLQEKWTKNYMKLHVSSILWL